MNIHKSFWTGKKVLITGISGFKGAWLALCLINFGASVYGFSRKPQRNQPLINCFDLLNSCQISYGDISNYDALYKFYLEVKPEIVFHLAAQPIVSDSYNDPLETIRSNILGTANVLETFRQLTPDSALVNITSDKCYKNTDNHQMEYIEDDELSGDDIYSASKACAELIQNAFNKSFFENKKIANASARAGNVIGGGDFTKDRIMTDIISSLTDGVALKLRSPNSVRPWQHVLCCISGYMKLAQKLYEDASFSGAWNFGPAKSDRVSVEKLCNYVQEYLRLNADLELKYEIIENKISEKKYLTLNSSKSYDLLNWETKNDVPTALKLSLDWYMAYFNGANMMEFSLNQINNSYYFRD